MINKKEVTETEIQEALKAGEFKESEMPKADPLKPPKKVAKPIPKTNVDGKPFTDWMRIGNLLNLDEYVSGKSIHSFKDKTVQILGIRKLNPMNKESPYLIRLKPIKENSLSIKTSAKMLSKQVEDILDKVEHDEKGNLKQKIVVKVKGTEVRNGNSVYDQFSFIDTDLTDEEIEKAFK